MQAFTERARQAFGLGSDVFVASNLDAHEATIEELGNFAAPLKSIEKATARFNQDTAEFLQATANLMTSCPLPRMWAQPSATEPAVPVPIAVPSDAAAWLDADTHHLLAREAPGVVGMAVKKELLAPMQQWLAAYDVAQAQLSSLQSGRLAYDAARRHLVTAAARAAKDAAEPASPRTPKSPTAAAFGATTASAPAAVAGGGDGEGGVRPPDVLLVSGGPQLAQLQEVAAATSAELAEYESKVEALDDTLAWLAGGAARIKAALADAGGSAAAAARSWQVPQGLLPPLQDRSTIGKDVDITMVMTNSPRSAEVAAAQVASGIAPTQAGDTTISLQPKDGDSSSTAGGRGKQQQESPDLSAILPKDETMVYGGGVHPPTTASASTPSGGGLGQYIKDTLTGPATDKTADTAATDAAAAAAAEEGGEDEPAEALSSAGSDLSTDEQLADELFHDAADDEEGDPTDTAISAAAAPEVLPRPSRSYSGEGVGQHEAGPAAAAAAQMRSGSGGLLVGRAYSGPGLAMQPGVQVADPERKQLSSVVLPAPGQDSLQAAAEAAAAADMPFAGAAAAADTTTASSSSSSGGGGLFAAIVRTVEEGGTRLKELAGQALFQVAQQEEHTFTGTAAAAESSGVNFEVQGADAADAAGAPGTASSSEAVEQQQQATPGSEMHIGPVAPFPGHEASPGSAEFVKGPTPPGGAAAAGEAGEGLQEEEQHRLAAEAGTDMHVGPVAPFPGHQPSPGSAEFVKGPTPPGGAAAAEAPAGDATATPPPQHADSAFKASAGGDSSSVLTTVKGVGSDAGSEGESTASSSKARGPDLSAMLPTYDQLPAGGHKTKPAGGGVGALLRDTLLGPRSDE